MQQTPAMSYQMISHSFSQHQDQSEKGFSLNNCISERPEWMCFISRWLTLLALFAEELSLASSSRGTCSIAGLETLYTADRIISFLQLVLKCQCVFHVWMNMLQHTGFLSKQTAWQNFGGAIYWLCQNTKKIKNCWAFFRIVTENWDFEEVEQLASASARIT